MVGGLLHGGRLQSDDFHRLFHLEKVDLDQRQDQRKVLLTFACSLVGAVSDKMVLAATGVALNGLTISAAKILTSAETMAGGAASYIFPCLLLRYT